MMTAMARLPCKSSVSNTQQNQQQQLLLEQQLDQQYLRKTNNFLINVNSNKNYWDMQPTRNTSAPPSYTRSQHRDHTGKRKSAVELLQESKAFYVKSEIVLDRKQELKNSGHLQVAPSLTTTATTTTTCTSSRLLRKTKNPIKLCGVGGGGGGGVQQSCTSPHLMNSGNECCWINCQDRNELILSPQRTLPPTLPPKSPRLISVPQRRTISGSLNNNTGNDQLQTKLRRLLNADSKENVYFPDTSGSLTPTNLTGRDDNFRFPPSGITRDDERLMSGHITSPIPQPDIRFKFGRSNSHSHTSGKNNRTTISSPPPIDTTICHKSLPDLHTSARRRASLSPRASTKQTIPPPPPRYYQQTNNCPDCETSSDYSDKSFKRDSVCYRSSRNMRSSLGSGGGGDASSVLSSGGRTQKSSGSSKISHGATARDSGGSSGHCTHRSDPPPRLQDCWSHIRRDSGASTQHSTEKDRSRKGSGYASGGTPPSVLRNFSPDSGDSNSQTDYSPTQNSSRLTDGWKEDRSRPILRSKSDISDRYWRHDVNSRNKKNPPKPPRSLSDLEIFFDCLGLDNDKYQRITLPTSNSSSPVFFDSVSSIDSALGLHQWTGNNQQSNSNNFNVANETTSQRVNDPPSIVERNARIIKWLCQCRKVQFEYN